MMRLKDWAEKVAGVSYLTSYRWFKNGTLPIKAFQTKSGTIIVGDEAEECEYFDNLQKNPITTDAINSNTDNAISLFLKKTVEFSKNNSTVEDFAAYVISNFQLKLNNTTETPRYSRNKPQPEDVQNHFKQFIPDKESQGHLKAIKTLIKEGPQPGDVVITPDMANEFNLQCLINEPVDDSNVLLYETATDGLVQRSVDLNNTPQQINYTGFNGQPVSQQSFAADLQALSHMLSNFGGGSAITTNSTFTGGSVAPAVSYFNAGLSPFQPTHQETQAVSKVIEETNETLPKKRGRKPSKAFK